MRLVVLPMTAVFTTSTRGTDVQHLGQAVLASGSEIGAGSGPEAGSGVRIDDPETASRLISNAYLPLRVAPATRHGAFRMRMGQVRMSRMTAGVLSLDSPARFTSSAAEHVHLNVTLRGRSVWRGHDQRHDQGHGAEPLVTGPGAGVVYNTGHTADSLWSGGCEQVCLMIPRQTLEGELETLAGRSLPAPLSFAPVLSLSGGLSRLLAPALQLLVGELHRADSVLRFPAASRHLEALVIDGLLLGHQHNHTELLHRPADPPGPTARAVQLLEERPGFAWTTVGLAREVHLSVRALQEGFKRQHDLTPMTYLRRVRLRRIHEVLTAARPGSLRIQDVAVRNGLLHLGRFSASYRNMYGELPSATLAREPR